MAYDANTRYFVTMNEPIQPHERFPETRDALSFRRQAHFALKAVALSLLLVACGGGEEAKEAPVANAGPPLPSLDEARTLLTSAPEFGDYHFTYTSIALPLEKARMNEPARDAARDLERGGWIETQRDQIVLSSKSAEDKRFNVRPNGFLEIVPLAKKEITEVGSVTEGPDGKPVVTFCWKWIPNPVGASLTKGPQKERFDAMQCAKASLIRIGDKWEVLAIEETAAPQGSAR